MRRPMRLAVALVIALLPAAALAQATAGDAGTTGSGSYGGGVAYGSGSYSGGSIENTQQPQGGKPGTRSSVGGNYGYGDKSGPSQTR